jgi:hypothetical protein
MSAQPPQEYLLHARRLGRENPIDQIDKYQRDSFCSGAVLQIRVDIVVILGSKKYAISLSLIDIRYRERT